MGQDHANAIRRLEATARPGRRHRAPSHGPPYADMLAHAGHNLVHDRFCIELMVSQISTLYDEAAVKARESEGVKR